MSLSVLNKSVASLVKKFEVSISTVLTSTTIRLFSSTSSPLSKVNHFLVPSSSEDRTEFSAGGNPRSGSVSESLIN